MSESFDKNNLIFEIVYKDEWMMSVLSTARSLKLPDWWIGAGFLRNKVWDVLHEMKSDPRDSDVDLIYFDPLNSSEEADTMLLTRVLQQHPGVNWSVKNQSRMHLRNGDAPYQSSTDAIRFWPEICTSVGIKLNDKSELAIAAPYGLDDILNLIVRPTPTFELKRDIYQARLLKKGWKTRWPKLQILGLSLKA